MRESIPCWQQNLAQGFASAAELLDFLRIPKTFASQDAEQSFKTRVPRGFAARMEIGNPRDPLLLQVLASNQEMQNTYDYSRDPLAESYATPRQGLLHKYQGRVLLVMTGSCAVHCRYCFRRHFPYQEHNPGRQGWEDALQYIAEDSSIHEVILSGGDPLLAKDNILAFFLERLSDIAHVKTVRFHTRIPIVLPERVTSNFVDMLQATPLRKVVVVHCNHPRELDNTVFEACKALSDAGCFLLNQSVLLAGINDDASILAALSEGLFDMGILPYYLHVLDKVQGASHFDVTQERALAIFRALQSLLPGYLVPKLAREEPGQRHKTLLV